MAKKANVGSESKVGAESKEDRAKAGTALQE